MKKFLIPIISISLLALWAGGAVGFATLWNNMLQIIKCLFPVFFEVGKMALEDYLTSPYFITGVIMSVASAFGIWFGKRKGKKLYLIVSLIVEITSLMSILMNIL